MIRAMAVRAVELRGYRPTYQSGNPLPGLLPLELVCRRHSAECGSCGTALPLAPRDGGAL
jgi:hypothetical protein